MRQRAQQVGGILDLNTTLRLDRPELRVEVDRERAADLRVDVEQIATALRLMVGGDQEVSRFHDPFSTYATAPPNGPLRPGELVPPGGDGDRAPGRPVEAPPI